MPDLHLLANLSSLVRHRVAETLVASAPAGEDVQADVQLRLARVGQVLDVELAVIDAVAQRGTLRPPIPAPQSLQDLVRAGRRRLERERLGTSRDWYARRLAAVTDLRVGLDS